MKLLPTALLVVVAASATPALAAVPVNDSAQLDQHTETSNTIIKLVPITTDRQKANQGVNCAVTTGKKANVTDPTVKPTAGNGIKAIQGYAPQMPSTPTAGATGGQLASETLFQSTSEVTGGIEATQSTIAANKTSYQNLGAEVGSATTVMAAWDQNSAVRTQNGLTWNTTINSLNQWVTALNALNLNQVNAVSRNTLAMQSGSGSGRTQATPTTTIVCPEGMVTNTSRRSSADPACVDKRYVDNTASVSSFLAAMQEQATETGAQSTATTTGQ